MMVGLPGSGKSTYAKKLEENYGYIVHSSDELREKLLLDVNDQSQNGAVFEELHRNIRADLQDGNNVVYDATNLNRKRRRHFLNFIQNVTCTKYCMFLPTPYETCLENNMKRDRQVPQHTISKMYKSIQIPHHSDGFDSVFINYEALKKEYNLSQTIQWLSKIEQDNPHHQYTVGEHCKRTARYIRDHGGNKTLQMAALLHDIGKPVCKAFLNTKGNPTDIAHYYGHENVSAYLAIGYLAKELESTEDILDAAFLINNHMRLMQLEHLKEKKDTSASKLHKQIGKEMMEALTLLYLADKINS